MGYTFVIFLIMAINTEYRMSWASGYNGGASNLENPLARRAIGKFPLMSTPVFDVFRGVSKWMEEVWMQLLLQNY